MLKVNLMDRDCGATLQHFYSTDNDIDSGVDSLILLAKRGVLANVVNGGRKPISGIWRAHSPNVTDIAIPISTRC